ncbi:hypothetical protein JHK84_042334 [Glycine max]|nr:hypothetical protein JHK85_042740 [Glycine max]KAG5116221.1 hypothetical protein JHK84_042334 [Glycine max]
MLRSLPKLSLLFSSARNPHYLSSAQRFISQGRIAASRGGLLHHEEYNIGVVSTIPIRSKLTSTISSAIASEMAAEDQVQRVNLLTSTDDNYGGVIVELDQHMDSATFVSILRASVSHWKLLGKKGVWIKLPIHLVNLVEALVKVLVVQENSGLFQGTGVWKFPTGVVDQGEDICVAAVREVKEETGVDSEFVEVLAFRQSHNSFFEKSDLFFMCMLRPLSSDIQAQRLEILNAQWMPFEEYAAQPFIQKSELLKYINDTCLAKMGGQYSGFSPVSTSSNFSDQKNYLYLSAGALKSSNSS